MIGILPYVAVAKELQNRFIPITAEPIRDLNILDAKSFISVLYRTLRCKLCCYVVEELSLMNPYERVTKRFATYFAELCKCMTIKEVAEHLELDWKTVKELHKRYLQGKFSREDIAKPRLFVVDEISLKKRHRYLTVIADWDSGKVLGVKGKKAIRHSKSSLILFRNKPEPPLRLLR